MTTNFKKKRIEDKPYLKWLPQQTCIVNNEECEGQVVGHHSGESGMGCKCDDKDAVPLCYCHHVGKFGIHTIGKKTWNDRYDIWFDVEVKYFNKKYERETGNKLKTE